ncbi:MAG: sigma-54 interaction domain-containing protein [Bdellovibrionales bacterium]
MSMQVFVVTKTNKVLPIDFNKLVTIGGSESTGIKVSELKKKSDYVLLKKGANHIVFNNLLKHTEEVKLEPYTSYTVNDLSLFAIPVASSSLDDEKRFKNFNEKLSFFLQKIHSKDELSDNLIQIISYICESLRFDKAMLITLNDKGEYEVSSGYNLSDGNHAWLSETLIQESLEQEKAVFVSNVIGSGYDQKQSIVASNFLSFFSFPIKSLDQKVGMLILGSSLPYSESNIIQDLELACLVNLLGVAIDHQRTVNSLSSKIKNLKANSKIPFHTNDTEFLEQIQLAEQISHANISVLIHGETGVGKEEMARWIHSSSDRSDGAFIAINCGAIPENLIESILFGHKKGAFTGAVNDQKGKIEQAHGGTLFLDEIGDLPLSAQVKLLRMLQERVVEPIGSSSSKKVDVRVLAASHKNLEKLMTENEFREDLYYRLAEVQIEIPALKERPEDAVLIATDYMLKNFPQKSLSPEALAWIRKKPWSGNARELISFIKRGATICRDQEIQVSHLMLGAPRKTDTMADTWLGGDNLEDAKSRFVDEKIKKALQLNDDNKTKAAKALGISPRTLFRYLEN